MTTALTTLNWKRLARGSVATVTNGIAEVLHSIFLTIQPSVTTLYNGNSRTSPITASEYTVAGPLTESVYWGYNVGALTHKSILSGRTSAATPTMVTTPAETYAVSQINAGITLSAGAFNAWDNANPFTSGRNFGYWRTSGVIATNQVWQWDFYECQEASALVLQQVSAATPFGLLSGAIIDPHSTSLATAESDGRVYGQCTGTGGVATTFMSAAAGFLAHTVTANTAVHAGIFDPPGTSSVSTIIKSAAYIYNTSSFAERGGQPMFRNNIPMDITASFSIGNLRQVGPGRINPIGTVLSSGGVDIAYAAFANSWTAFNQAAYLAA